MTKVQNPIIGRAKGSAGGMTFSKNYDKNVMRAKAFEVNNPNTQAQQTQRGSPKCRKSPRALPKRSFARSSGKSPRR